MKIKRQPKEKAVIDEFQGGVTEGIRNDAGQGERFQKVDGFGTFRFYGGRPREVIVIDVVDLGVGGWNAGAPSSLDAVVAGGRGAGQKAIAFLRIIRIAGGL